jgi:putative tricarboxylic transport membrane protein
MTRIQGERLAALAILLFALAYFWMAFDIKVPPSSDDSPFSARSFPLALGPAAAILALILLVKPSHSDDIGALRFKWARAAGLIALMGLFALAITHLGFVVTSALFLAGGFFVLGERRPLVLALVALGVSLGFWIMFTLLDVKLDWGVFGRMFG